MSRKNKKSKWFIQVRGSYLPNGLIGTSIYLLYVTYLVILMFAWYKESFSLWSLVSFVIPLSVGSAIITQYIASKHS